jgi:PAS domain S-box-containing protein
MNLNVDLLKAIFSATFWVSVFLSIILFRRRETAGARFLSFLIFSSAIWTGGILFGLLGNSIQMKDIGMKIVYLGSVFVPSFLLAFVLDFAGLKKWISWKLFIPLNVFAVIVLFLAINPSTQFLLWEVKSINPENFTAFHSNGPLYLPWILYAYLLYAVAIFLLFKELRSSSVKNKRQILVFICAIIPPILFHLIFLFQPDPSNLINPTPLGFAVGVAIIFFGIYNFQVFSLIPVARQKVIETISDAVLVLDNYSRVVMHNEAFRKLFGLGNQKLLGKHLENLLPQFDDVITSIKIEEQVLLHEYAFNNKTFDLSVKPILRNEKKIAGKLIVLHDISHQKMMVDQLHISNNHLKEQLVFNESLIEDLSAFSHTVAHNLKEPLNNIVGFSNLISRNELDEATKKEFIEQICSTGLKMNEIIDELLLLSGISVKEIITQPIDIGLSINNALIRNEHEIMIRKATIVIPDRWPEVLGYAPWIEEAWSNLISNALKYGGEIPELTFGYEMKGENEIIFYIQDNGKGLSKEQIDRLFIPFSLLENSEEGSHGLGLSIVKRIISKLNGSIWVESEHITGKGSKFCFTLPLK